MFICGLCHVVGFNLFSILALQIVMFLLVVPNFSVNPIFPIISATPQHQLQLLQRLLWVQRVAGKAPAPAVPRLLGPEQQPRQPDTHLREPRLRQLEERGRLESRGVAS